MGVSPLMEWLIKQNGEMDGLIKQNDKKSKKKNKAIQHLEKEQSKEVVEPLYRTLHVEKEIHHLFIDLNSLVHSHFRNGLGDRLEFFNELVRRVLNSIDEQVKLLRPKKLLFLCFDGVPSLGKIRLQIWRRMSKYKAHASSSNLRQVFEEEKQKGNVTYRCELSPGTDMMDKLSEKLIDHVLYKLSHPEHRWEFEVILSDSNVPGEGEQKIMSFMKEYANLCCYKMDEFYALLSKDSDTIMLSLLTHEPQLFVYWKREEKKESKKEKNEGNINKVHKINEITGISEKFYQGFEMCRLLQVRGFVQKKLDPVGHANQDPIKENLMEDFIFMTLPLGNDYLPKADDGVNTVETLIEAYQGMHGNYITSYDEVHVPNFLRLLEAFLSKEAEKFQKKAENIIEWASSRRSTYKELNARNLLKSLGVDVDVDRKELAVMMMTRKHGEPSEAKAQAKIYIKCLACTWHLLITMDSYWEWCYKANCFPHIAFMREIFEQEWKVEVKETILEPLIHLLLVVPPGCTGILPKSYKEFRELPHISDLFGDSTEENEPAKKAEESKEEEEHMQKERESKEEEEHMQKERESKEEEEHMQHMQLDDATDDGKKAEKGESSESLGMHEKEVEGIIGQTCQMSIEEEKTDEVKEEKKSKKKSKKKEEMKEEKEEAKKEIDAEQIMEEIKKARAVGMLEVTDAEAKRNKVSTPIIFSKSKNEISLCLEAKAVTEDDQDLVRRSKEAGVSFKRFEIPVRSAAEMKERWSRHLQNIEAHNRRRP